ncbi:YjcZ family sporulation protein [Paenibacillus albidus]|nr:YjcZ family sporulation protein [Paenibacillus albidus]
MNQGPPVCPVVSPYTSTSAILVLFILLVIITKACLF